MIEFLTILYIGLRLKVGDSLWIYSTKFIAKLSAKFLKTQNSFFFISKEK